MPVVTNYESTQVFEKLEQAVTNHNFVIHEASEMPGFPARQIENMIFLVAFVNKNGEPNKERTRIWVSGNLMNDLICHKLKKYKFVSGETVVGRKKMDGRKDSDCVDTVCGSSEYKIGPLILTSIIQ